MENALENAPRVPHNPLIQEEVEITPGPTDTTPPTQPYDIIDKIFEHGEADDGMPVLPTGTPVWLVRWYGQACHDDPWEPTSAWENLR